MEYGPLLKRQISPKERFEFRTMFRALFVLPCFYSHHMKIERALRFSPASGRKLKKRTSPAPWCFIDQSPETRHDSASNPVVNLCMFTKLQNSLLPTTHSTKNQQSQHQSPHDPNDDNYGTHSNTTPVDRARQCRQLRHATYRPLLKRTSTLEEFNDFLRPARCMPRWGRVR